MTIFSCVRVYLAHYGTDSFDSHWNLTSEIIFILKNYVFSGQYLILIELRRKCRTKCLRDAHLIQEKNILNDIFP